MLGGTLWGAKFAQGTDMFWRISGGCEFGTSGGCDFGTWTAAQSLWMLILWWPNQFRYCAAVRFSLHIPISKKRSCPNKSQEQSMSRVCYLGVQLGISWHINVYNTIIYIYTIYIYDIMYELCIYVYTVCVYNTYIYIYYIVMVITSISWGTYV